MENRSVEIVPCLPQPRYNKMFQKPTQQLAKVGLGQSFAGGRRERTGVLRCLSRCKIWDWVT